MLLSGCSSEEKHHYRSHAAYLIIAQQDHKRSVAVHRPQRQDLTRFSSKKAWLPSPILFTTYHHCLICTSLLSGWSAGKIPVFYVMHIRCVICFHIHCCMFLYQGYFLGLLLAGQWLRLHASNAGWGWREGFNPGWEIKIPHATQCSQKQFFF